MGLITQTVGTRTAVTVTGFSSLANGTYCVSNVITLNTNHPIEVALDIRAVTLDTPTGNKRVVVFAVESLDGTNFRSGPTGGTDATDEIMLLPLGVLEVSASGDGRATFPLARTLGYVPHSFKVVLKNETGSSLAVGTLHAAEISMSVA